MSWKQRLATARALHHAKADSAERANSSPAGRPADPNGPIGTNGRGLGEPKGAATSPIGTIGTNGTGTVEPAQLDPADAIDAYRERLAICLEAGDIGEDEAHGIAAAEAGADLDTLAQRLVLIWRQRLAAWQAAGPALGALRLELLGHVREPWLVAAAAAGWSDVAVFGAHPVAPLVRVECWGLAVWLALSPHNRGDRRVRLVSLDAGRAIIETPTGARFGMTPTAAGFDQGTPIWGVGEERSGNTPAKTWRRASPGPSSNLLQTAGAVSGGNPRECSSSSRLCPSRTAVTGDKEEQCNARRQPVK